jgi:glycosyltransferase involved in cell wall biosynthesis
MSNLDALITFIIPCKGRLEHLRISLPRLVTQQNSSVIVVDSNCPDGTANWVSANFPTVKIVYLNDDGIFNLAKSRNKGLEITVTKWVCFIDVDVVLKEGFVTQVAPLLNENTYYVFEHNPEKAGVFGSCIIPRIPLNKIGCYDEVFEGYGGDARDLYYRLERAGLHKYSLTHEFVDFVIQHPDTLRSKYYQEKDIRISQSCNALYRLAKLNLSLLGEECNLDITKRRELYALACEAVKRAHGSTNHQAELKLQVPINASDKSNFNLAQFKRSISLEIDLSRIADDGSNAS